MGLGNICWGKWSLIEVSSTGDAELNWAWSSWFSKRQNPFREYTPVASNISSRANRLSTLSSLKLSCPSGKEMGCLNKRGSSMLRERNLTWKEEEKGPVISPE